MGQHPLQTSGSRRYGIIAPDLTKENIIKAIKNRNTFAVLNGRAGSSYYPLALALKVNGTLMGGETKFSNSINYEIYVKDSQKTIVELWENIKLGNKKRERTLLENLQKASNISKKDVKYKSKDVVSRLRKILREASGIPSEATRDPKPILWKNGKATRIFQMGKSDTVISNEPELKDEDSIEFISKFDKKELHPEKGSFHID